MPTDSTQVLLTWESLRNGSRRTTLHDCPSRALVDDLVLSLAEASEGSYALVDVKLSA